MNNLSNLIEEASALGKKDSKKSIYKSILENIEFNESGEAELKITNSNLLPLLKFFEPKLLKKNTILNYLSNFINKDDDQVFKTLIRVDDDQIIATNGYVCCFAKNGLYNNVGVKVMDLADVSYPNVNKAKESILENLNLISQNVSLKNYLDLFSIDENDFLSSDFIVDKNFYFNNLYVKKIFSCNKNFDIFINNNSVPILIFENEEITIMLMSAKPKTNEK